LCIEFDNTKIVQKVVLLLKQDKLLILFRLKIFTCASLLKNLKCVVRAEANENGIIESDETKH